MTTATSWRETWHPLDPDRVCWGCGEPPTHRYPDGSPGYRSHTHPTYTATPEDIERWGEMPWVYLSSEEVADARRYARARSGSSLRLGSKDRAGLVVEGNDRVRLDFDGVLGEMALAKWLGVPFEPGDGPSATPDVGPYFVRATRHRDGHLLWRPASGREHADPEGPYALVVIAPPALYVAGWLPSEVCRTFPLRSPDPKRRKAYMVPQGALRAIPKGEAGLLVVGGS